MRQLGHRRTHNDTHHINDGVRQSDHSNKYDYNNTTTTMAHQTTATNSMTSTRGLQPTDRGPSATPVSRDVSTVLGPPPNTLKASTSKCRTGHTNNNPVSNPTNARPVTHDSTGVLFSPQYGPGCMISKHHHDENLQSHDAVHRRDQDHTTDNDDNDSPTSTASIMRTTTTGNKR
ncbi:hypothetical protein SCLCIDRAFT_1099562 [Scleroderma citrinum Foug A]|uniref:Uncharacterized protein n=1 Tax=Scleroderma citrinum Foug A TaxID=1036808 RepID=A0A0C3A0M1_9AGAM|nr:hypothetical protein SCLCIDRAFT_1099562 [Scleroderma citrinum Foug A]